MWLQIIAWGSYHRHSVGTTHTSGPLRGKKKDLSLPGLLDSQRWTAVCMSFSTRLLKSLKNNENRLSTWSSPHPCCTFHESLEERLRGMGAGGMNASVKCGRGRVLGNAGGDSRNKTTGHWCQPYQGKLGYLRLELRELKDEVLPGPSSEA